MGDLLELRPETRGTWLGAPKLSATAATGPAHVEDPRRRSPPLPAAPANQELAHAPAVARLGQRGFLVGPVQKGLQFLELLVVKVPVQALGRSFLGLLLRAQALQ